MRLIFTALFSFWSIAALAQVGNLFSGAPISTATADTFCDISTGIVTGPGSGLGACASPTATCNGVVDDATAFTSINTWATAVLQPAFPNQRIVINFPPLSNCNIVGQTVTCGWNGNKFCPFINIKNFIVDMGGGTFTPGVISLAGINMQSNNLVSARAVSATAGDSCVTLIATPTATITAASKATGKWRVTIADTSGFVSPRAYYFSGVVGATLINGLQMVSVIDATTLEVLTAGTGQTYTSGGTIGGDRTSIFTVGQYAVIGGFNIQALWLSPFGSPPNLHVFEYGKVASIDAGTHQVCFDTPLVYSYKDTWPNFNTGNNGEQDAGGPATLYKLDPSWDTVAEFRNGTITKSGQTQAFGRSITYRDMTFTSSNSSGDCGTPSLNYSWRAINVNMTGCTMEVDKLITSILFDTVTHKLVKFQSSSTDLITIQNSTLTTGLSGTPKRMIGSNSTIAAFTPGANSYGTSNSVACTNCILGTITSGAYNQPITGITISGGVVSFANTAASGSGPAERWTTPRANTYLSGGGTTPLTSLFRLGDATQDITNFSIPTNLVSGFPPTPTVLNLQPHPAPDFTCTNCSGSIVATSVSLCAANRPLFSCEKIVWTPTSAQGNYGSLPAVGQVTSFTIDVTVPCTAAGACSLQPAGQFHNFMVKQSDGSVFDYTPSINLKTAGKRIITASGVTCNAVAGSCSGDSGLDFSAQGNLWANLIAPFMGSSFTGAPTFSIEILTDQGVVVPYRRPANDNRSVTRRRRRRAA